MTQPIGSGARGPWLPPAVALPSPDGGAPDAHPALDASTVPDWLLPLPPPPTPEPATAAELAAAAEAAAQATTRERLDAFRARTTLDLRSTDGAATEPVPIGFRMSHPYEKDLPPAPRKALEDATKLAGLTEQERNWLKAGRATPEQIARVTQNLIDAGHLPASSWDGQTSFFARVRQMMVEHRLGLDCAGYVQQAFLAAHGVPRSRTAFRPPERENLSGLDRLGFQKVSMTDLRPGDLLILKAQPSAQPTRDNVGHTAIVYDVHDLTRAEAMSLWDCGVPRNVAEVGRMRTMVLDSSWGNYGNPLLGGVQRVPFFQDKTTGQWLWVQPDGLIGAGTAERPYGHPVDGAYRSKQ